MIEVLSKNPRILLIHDFLSEDEADRFLAASKGAFHDSRTVCEKPEGCVTSYRTSFSAYLPRSGFTSAISNRATQVAGLLGADPEEIQVVRYEPGQEFKPHLDTSANRRTSEGRRTATVLAYLNDDFTGGDTVFPRLGLRVKPRRLAALYWHNILPTGKVDLRTFHGGEPVLSGVKYACNIWIRDGISSTRSAMALHGTLGTMPLTGLAGSGFRPSLESDAKRFGMPVTRIPYDIGPKGVRRTLKEMGRMIREGALSPAMRQFAEAVVRASGVGVNDALSDRKAGQILLDFVRRHVRYRPDQDMVEYVQTAAITLCVPGAALCIPVGDCDDLTVALGTLMAAYGMRVKLLKQTYGSGDQEHVLVIFYDSSSSGTGQWGGGSGWLAADPSAPVGTPVGWKSSSSSDVEVDPSDPKTLDLVDAPEAEYVGVGRLGALRLRMLRGLSPQDVATDLTNQFTAVILQADGLLVANPPEYSTAVSTYQAAGAVGAQVLGPEIDSLSSSGATKTFTQTAWTINGALALVNNSTTASASDAANAQALARQMLLLYQQALSVAGYVPDPSVSIANVVVGMGLAAVVGGVLWGMLKTPARRRASR